MSKRLVTDAVAIQAGVWAGNIVPYRHDDLDIKVAASYINALLDTREELLAALEEALEWAASTGVGLNHLEGVLARVRGEL